MIVVELRVGRQRINLARFGGDDIQMLPLAFFKISEDIFLEIGGVDDDRPWRRTVLGRGYGTSDHHEHQVFTVR